MSVIATVSIQMMPTFHFISFSHTLIDSDAKMHTFKIKPPSIPCNQLNGKSKEQKNKMYFLSHVMDFCQLESVNRGTPYDFHIH